MLMQRFALFVGVVMVGVMFSSTSWSASDLLVETSPESKGGSSSSSPSDLVTREHPSGALQRIEMDAKIHDARTAVMQLNAVDAQKLANVKAMSLVRHFDAVSPPMRRHEGRDVAKVVPGSLADKVWTGKSGVSHFTLYGPYMELKPGKYVVIFRLRLLEKSTAKSIISIGMANKQATVTERQVKAAEAPVDEWRVFAVPFTAKKTLSSVEFRAWQHRKSVAIDRVYLFEVEEGDGGEG